MSELDINDIRKLLPHHYPFLLVDKVLELEVGKRIVAQKNVTMNEPHFQGHFPVMPVMPGVLIVEALAQASGILIFKTLGLTSVENIKDLFYLAGVNDARFKRQVIPGDVLTLEVEIEKHKLNLWKFRCVASVDGEVACSAIIMNAKGSE